MSLLYFLKCLPFTSPENLLYLPDDVLVEQNNPRKLYEVSFYHLKRLCRSAGKYLPTQLKHLMSCVIEESSKTSQLFHLESSSSTQTNALSVEQMSIIDNTTNFPHQVHKYLPWLIQENDSHLADL